MRSVNSSGEKKSPKCRGDMGGNAPLRKVRGVFCRGRRIIDQHSKLVLSHYYYEDTQEFLAL